MTPAERARLIVDDWEGRGSSLKNTLAPWVLEALWDAITLGLRAALAEEREACARVAESAAYSIRTAGSVAQFNAEVAAAIRARL